MLSPWHAACIVFCAGCFYPAPAWEAMNRAATIDTPQNHQQVQALVLDRPTVPVWVVARDQDGDDLSFFWLANGAPIAEVTTTATDERFVSSATLTRDPSLDGGEVRCIVSDGTFEDDIEIFWTVEVP